MSKLVLLPQGFLVMVKALKALKNRVRKPPKCYCLYIYKNTLIRGQNWFLNFGVCFGGAHKNNTLNFCFS